jgi:hypothetical protein
MGLTIAKPGDGENSFSWQGAGRGVYGASLSASSQTNGSSGPLER